MYKYLDSVSSPADVRKLSNAEIKSLAGEIRAFLIDSVSKTGGHLASNLGVVELTLALYRVFDAPRDKIIFDVGHQSYVSKIITGRKDSFSTLRREGGISGFPKMSESEYDAFGTGHSSTALSAALGIASANKLSGNDDYAVAVVGDGAFSGGLAYEALNNCSPNLNLIVIFNENGMSISPSVGNTSRMISRIRSKENYFKFKSTFIRVVEKIPFAGSSIAAGMRRIKKVLKNAILNTNIIENFGFTYYGPVDGNDFVTLERVIRQAKKQGGSAFVHVKTVKGKGYAPAEENPSKFHMVKPAGAVSCDSTFSSEFGKYITELAKENDKICAITAAMVDGTGIKNFFDAFPERAFDVGIAEEHAVTFAGGLSAQGFVPVFAVYSSFFQRSYDELIHDISLQNLKCIFALDRAGFSPDDGATHHGIFDVAMLSQIKGAYIYSPISYKSLKDTLSEAIVGDTSIVAVRYPKGSEDAEGLTEISQYLYCDSDSLQNPDVIIATYGRIYKEAIKAKNILLESGINCKILVFEKIKPYEDVCRKISELSGNAKYLVLLEEGILSGGFCQNVLSELNFRNSSCFKNIFSFAIDGEIPAHGTLETLYKMSKISAYDIAEKVKKYENRCISC